MMNTTITRKQLFQTQRQYTQYMISNLINRFGDSLDQIATAWLVYKISNSAALSALSVTINMIPTVLFTPFLGAWIEKLNKKKVLYIVDTIRALLVVLLAIGYLLDVLTPGLLLCFTFVISTVEAFGEPAVSSFIPQVLEEEYYEVGVGTNKSLSGIVQLVGTASAGVIISIIGIFGAYVLDAATFLISALLKFSITYEEREDESVQSSKYLDLLKEGFYYLKTSKVLMYFCFIGILLNCFLVPFNAFLVPYISLYLNNNVSVVSVFSFCITVGSILGGYFYPVFAKRFSKKLQISLIALAIAISYFMMGVFPAASIPVLFTIVILAISFVSIGIFSSIASAALNVMFMKEIEAKYLSRASAIFSAVIVSAMPLTSFLLSMMVKFIDLRLIFIAFSLFCIAMFVILKGKSVTE